MVLFLFTKTIYKKLFLKNIHKNKLKEYEKLFFFKIFIDFERKMKK